MGYRLVEVSRDFKTRIKMCLLELGADGGKIEQIGDGLSVFFGKEIERLEILNSKREMLIRLLVSFTSHDEDCTFLEDGECTCGLEKILDKWEDPDTFPFSNQMINVALDCLIFDISGKLKGFKNEESFAVVATDPDVRSRLAEWYAQELSHVQDIQAERESSGE